MEGILRSDRPRDRWLPRNPRNGAEQRTHLIANGDRLVQNAAKLAAKWQVADGQVVDLSNLECQRKCLVSVWGLTAKTGRIGNVPPDLRVQILVYPQNVPKERCVN